MRAAKGGRGGKGGRVTLRERDRKSTRLNSSHSQISYAVFCLKKKNERDLGKTFCKRCLIHHPNLPMLTLHSDLLFCHVRDARVAGANHLRYVYLLVV